MKNISFWFLFIPLLIYTPSALSSSFPNGSYSVPSLSTRQMQTNISRLTNEIMEYNASLPFELQTVQRNNMSNRYYNQTGSFYNGNSLYQNTNTYESPQILQRNNQQNEQLQRNTNIWKKDSNDTLKWWQN